MKSTPTLPPPAATRFSGLHSAAIGAAVWAVLLLWRRPSPFEFEWTETLLLLAPLILVPVGMELVRCTEPFGPDARLWRWSRRLQLPAALALAVAFRLPEGFSAACLALPWFATTTLIALAGLVRVLRRGLRPLEESCVDGALIYLAVGGGWVLLARLGARPLEFSAMIVLLTAVHFHHAGFVLPLMTGLAGQALSGTSARLAAAGVMLGVPAVAVGITASQMELGPMLECLAAILTALSGLLTALLYLRLTVRAGSAWPPRILWAVAAVSLAPSMVLAALYGSRSYITVEWLDIPWMRAVHGTANALGFGLSGLLGWTVVRTRNSAIPPGENGRSSAV